MIQVLKCKDVFRIYEKHFENFQDILQKEKQKLDPLTMIKINNILNNNIPGFMDTINKLKGKNPKEAIEEIVNLFNQSGIKEKFVNFFKYEDLYGNSKNLNAFLLAFTLSSILIYSYSLMFEISIYKNKRLAMLVMFLLLLCVFTVLFSSVKSNPIVYVLRNEFHRFCSNNKFLFTLNFILVGVFIYYFQEINRYFIKPFFLVCLVPSLFIIYNLKFPNSPETKEKNIFNIFLTPVIITGVSALYFYTFYKYNPRNMYHLGGFVIIFLLSFLKSYGDPGLENKIFPTITASLMRLIGFSHETSINISLNPLTYYLILIIFATSMQFTGFVLRILTFLLSFLCLFLLFFYFMIRNSFGHAKQTIKSVFQL